MYLEANAQPVVLDTLFTGNRASTSGGGACIQGSAVIRRCTFVGNEVTTPGPIATGGGGILVSGGAAVIDQCFVQGNRSAGRGGGVCISGGNVSLSHSQILENEAVIGGGIKLGSTTTNQSASIHDCLVAGNVGTGILKEINSFARITHCTVVGNHALTAGAGFRHQGSNGASPTLVSNCIFWRNFTEDGTQVSSSSSPATDLRYSVVFGGAAGVSGGVTIGAGFLSADPLFLDPDGPDDDPTTLLDNDYRLASGSPCIDAGSSSDVSLDNGDVDEDGNTGEPNPFDLALQRRFADDPAVPDTGEGSSAIVDIGAYERQP